MILNTLFDITINDVSINISLIVDCRDGYFEFLYNNSHKVGMQYYPILSEFFKQSSIVTDYYMDCQYNEIANNYRMRFMIVRADNDYYLIPLRIVDPINKKKADRHFIISHDIISLKGTSTEMVYRTISKMIESATIASDDIANASNVVFYNTKDIMDKWKSKWKSKHGINRLGEIVLIQVYKVVPKDTLSEIIKLSHKWTEIKGKKTPDKIITEFCKSDGGYCITYSVGSLVGFQLITLGYNNVATCHISKSYVNDRITKIHGDYISKYIGSFMIYCLHLICFDKLNASIVNYLGVRDIKKYKSLYDFKRKYFKSYVVYKNTLIKNIISNFKN